MRVRPPAQTFLCRLAALLAILASTPLAAQADNASFIDDFITIALGREYGDDAEGQLIRWKKPLRLRVIGENAFFYLPAVEQHIGDLRESTGHPISLVKQGQAEMIVVFVPSLTREEIETYGDIYRPLFANEQAYQRQLGHLGQNSFEATCLATFRANRHQGEITGAVIFIPTDKGIATAWQCIVEETTQAMGLPNDSDNVFHSIFNDRSPHISLTPKDKRMLRLLYHPRLQPGSREPEVRKAAASALREMAGR